MSDLDDPDRLREMYHGEHMTLEEMAGECGVSVDTVMRRMEDHGIPRRERRNLPSDRRLMDGEWLRGRYEGDGASIRELARETGCGRRTVRRWLEEHGVEPRGDGTTGPSDERLADEGWLREQYRDEGRTMADIGDELGVADTTVSKWLDRHGIEKRPRGKDLEYSRLRDVEWLREKYHEEGMTQSEIAELVGCATDTVSRAMREVGVEARPRGPAPL